jgi:hypothetical protein
MTLQESNIRSNVIARHILLNVAHSLLRLSMWVAKVSDSMTPNKLPFSFAAGTKNLNVINSVKPSNNSYPMNGNLPYEDDWLADTLYRYRH